MNDPNTPTILAELEAAHAQLQANHPDDVRSILQRVLLRDDLRSQLSANPDDLDRIERLQVVLGGARRCSGLARKLQRIVAPLAGAGDASVCVGDLLGLDLPTDIQVPSGWALDEGGLSCDGQAVTTAPISVVGRVRDVDSDELGLVVCYPYLGRVRTEAILRRDAARASALVRELSGRGAPVHEGNARDVGRFLVEQDAHNADRLPTTEAMDRLGWCRTEAFQLGATTIRLDDTGAAPIRVAVAADFDSLVSGYRTGGTWAGWLEHVYGPVSTHPRPLLALYAAMAAPLVRVIASASNFTFELAGLTSVGKTTALKAAASAWGYPETRGDGVLLTWDATAYYLQTVAAFTTDLPLFVDDTTRARNPDHVTQFIYNIEGGQTRGQGKPDGVRAQRPVRTVALITGESPAHSLSEKGGVRGRVLSLLGPVFDLDPSEARGFVDRLRAGCLLHYGHLAPRFLRRLVDRPDLYADLAPAHAAYAQSWGEGLGPVGGRLAAHVALLQLTAELVHDLTDLPLPACDPWREARSVLEEADRTEDRPTAALEHAYAMLTTQPSRFYSGLLGGGEGLREPGQGWLGAAETGARSFEVAFIRPSLEAELRRMGFQVDTTLRAWRERGWLVHDKDRFDAKRTVGSTRPRCIVVRAEALQAVGLQDAGAL